MRTRIESTGTPQKKSISKCDREKHRALEPALSHRPGHFTIQDTHGRRLVEHANGEKHSGHPYQQSVRESQQTTSSTNSIRRVQPSVPSNITKGGRAKINTNLALLSSSFVGFQKSSQMSDKFGCFGASDSESDVYMASVHNDELSKNNRASYQPSSWSSIKISGADTVIAGRSSTPQYHSITTQEQRSYSAVKKWQSKTMAPFAEEQSLTMSSCTTGKDSDVRDQITETPLPNSRKGVGQTAPSQQTIALNECGNGTVVKATNPGKGRPSHDGRKIPTSDVSQSCNKRTVSTSMCTDAESDGGASNTTCFTAHAGEHVTIGRIGHEATSSIASSKCEKRRKPLEDPGSKSCVNNNSIATVTQTCNVDTGRTIPRANGRNATDSATTQAKESVEVEATQSSSDPVQGTSTRKTYTLKEKLRMAENDLNVTDELMKLIRCPM